MSIRSSVTVMGFAGPDGAGKSTLVAKTVDAAVAGGIPVHRVYLYGCVVCRNLSLPGVLRRSASSPGVVSLERPETPLLRQRTWWHRLHAAVDSAELAVRLAWACHRARRTQLGARSGVLVLTDRTPLDTLVKHDPPLRGPITSLLRALGRRYAALNLLDAGSELLAVRDREHSAAGLEQARENYRRWSTQLPNVRAISTHGRPPEELAREMLEHVVRRGGGESTRPLPPVSLATAGRAARPLRDVRGLKALLLTSHPVSGRDGADSEIAIGLAQGLPEVTFTYLGRLGREPEAPGRVVPLMSRTSLPGVITSAQAAAWTPVLTRSVDLVHVVMTVGPRYAAWSRSSFAPRARPVVVTVPGVVSPEYLERSRPLGVTVALSETTADLLRRHGHPDVRVIPPGIDLSRWPYLAPRPKPRPVLFFAGHTDPQGGSKQAIDVAARIQRAGIPLRLVMGLRVRTWQSEIQELRQIEHMARLAGLDQVEINGHIEHMPEALADADVVLFMPERLEGGKADIPLVVLEAVASGRPTIVARLPQMEALSGVAEQLPVGALDEAAASIQHLLRSPVLYEERARAGRAAVEQRFTTTRMCESYARLYGELMAQAERRARDSA